MTSILSYSSGRSENEASRRLYRAAGETAQRLEQTLSQVSTFGNLFSPELTELRTKLKDYCERLIFTDPVEFGKKTEDLLWRKVYYEFFQKFKQNKKKLLESDYYQHALRSHLLAAIGSYHHMLLRIQTEFHIDLNGNVDVPFLWQMKGVKKERWKKYQQSAASDSVVQAWANQACHRILTYLGDIARYIAELQPEPENNRLAERYYLQAFCLNVNNGIPHNQLGSLADNRFDSAYHYMRCLTSVDKFEVSEGNLIRMFEKNSQVLQEIESIPKSIDVSQNPSKFLTRFLKVCEALYFGPDGNLQNYCQEALQDFHSCIPLNGDFEAVFSDGDSLLNESTIFKIVVMCIMSISRLHDKESPDVSTATAFTLALFSSIVHFSSLYLISTVYERTDDAVIENNESEDVHKSSNTVTSDKPILYNNELNQLHSDRKSNGKKSMKKFTALGLRKLRRRRKISNTSQEDSELSDVEIIELAESDEENGPLNCDASQNGSCSSESEEEQNNEQNENKSLKDDSNSDVFIDAVEVLDKPTVPNDNSNELDLKNDECQIVTNSNHSNILLPADKLLEVLGKNELLISLKVLMDWLKLNKEILIHRCDSLGFFFSRLTELFNLLLKLEEQLLKNTGDEFSRLVRSDSDGQQKFVLPEDILLQGLPSLYQIHQQLSFQVSKRKELSLIEQVFFRLQCLLSFGESMNCEFIDYNKEKRIFRLKISANNKSKVKNCTKNEISGGVVQQKTQLMHDMAHLWLKAEVNNLERSIQSSGNPQLSPLLVVETSAFCHHLSLLKQLIAAKCFVIIVPNIVIENLDEIKKKSAGAREAIRWLEYVFRKGNRHIRAQRDNERSPVNPMKYPKRKDKESWDFFQILECSHFLVQQQSVSKSSSMVTLLVGTNNQLPSNASALARSLSISMENLESFFSKWRPSSKKPG